MKRVDLRGVPCTLVLLALAWFSSGSSVPILFVISSHDLPKDNRIPEAAKAILENADHFELLSLDPLYRGK